MSRMNVWLNSKPMLTSLLQHFKAHWELLATFCWSSFLPFRSAIGFELPDCFTSSSDLCFVTPCNGGGDAHVNIGRKDLRDSSEQMDCFWAAAQDVILTLGARWSLQWKTQLPLRLMGRKTVGLLHG